MTGVDGDRTAAVTENVSIELTTRCTGNCVHCFARAGREIDHELDFPTARQVIDEGARLGYRGLHLTGGEPLLYPYIFDLLEYAVSLGYASFFVNTNGTLITKEIATRLAGYGPGLNISLSLQGPEELHDRARGKGAFRAAIAGLEQTLTAGVGVFTFAATGKALLPELPCFAEFLFSAYPALRELTLIQLIRVPGDTRDLSAELLAPDDFATMVRMTALLNLYGYRVSVLQNPLATAVSRALGMPWVPPAAPLYRTGSLIVLADRSITLAHSSRESFGIYAPGALSAVLESEDYATATGPDDAACSPCRHFALCRENGMIRPSEWFRDSGEGGEPFCKRVMGAVTP